MPNCALTGHWGQIVVVVPSRELVIVRMGWTAPADAFDRCAFVAGLVAAVER